MKNSSQKREQNEKKKEALNEYLEALKVVDYWTGKVRELNGAFIYRSPSSNTELPTKAIGNPTVSVSMEMETAEEARKGPGLIKKGGAAKSSATGGAAQQPQPKTRQTTSLPTCLNTRTKSEGTRALCSRKSIFSRLRISGRLNSSIGVRRRARRNDKPREGSNQAGQHRHSAGR